MLAYRSDQKPTVFISEISFSGDGSSGDKGRMWQTFMSGSLVMVKFYKTWKIITVTVSFKILKFLELTNDNVHFFLPKRNHLTLQTDPRLGEKVHGKRQHH